MGKKLIMLVAFTLLSVLLVAGCKSKQESTDTGQKTLTIGIAKDISGFDVHQTTTTLTASVQVNVFEYLVVKDRDQNMKPGLAESWENIDPLVWRLKLKKNVKFHNGDPFTAEDVKFTLERIAKDAQFTENRNYRQIKEVKIVDDHTVDIVTNSPDPVLMNRISRLASGMLPSKYIKEKGMEEFMKNPVGTGPYKYKTWSRDNEIVLVKNPDYYGEPPKWDTVKYRIIPEASTRVAELLTGGVDIALDILPSDIERVNGSAKAKIVRGDTKRVLALQVPLSKGELADPRVREAIDLAINEDVIVKQIYDGGAIPTRTLTVRGTPGLNESLYSTYSYDLARAKQLLKEAGLENGFNVTLTTANGQYLKDKEMVQLIASMLGEAGINAKLEILESSSFAEKKSAKKFSGLWLNGFSNSLNDPATDYASFVSKDAAGITDYNNPEFDKIYKHAETNMEPDSRMKEFQTLQQMLAKDRPTLPLVQLQGIYGVNNRVNFVPRVDEMLVLDEVELKK